MGSTRPSASPDGRGATSGRSCSRSASMGDPQIVKVFALGVLGGGLVELVRWWKLREAPEFPLYAKKPGYWAITALMVAAGGVMATLYGLDARNTVALVNIGASTPAILGVLASKATALGGSDPGPSGLGEKSFKGSGLQGVAHAELVRRFVAFGR